MGSLAEMKIIDRKLVAPILECLKAKGVKCGGLPGTSKVQVYSDVDYDEAVGGLKKTLAGCDPEWEKALRIVPSPQS